MRTVVTSQRSELTSEQECADHVIGEGCWLFFFFFQDRRSAKFSLERILKQKLSLALHFIVVAMVGWSLEFNVLATSKILSGLVRICEVYMRGGFIVLPH